MNPNASYLSNLTPLRGIAAMLTVLYHVDVWIGGGGMLLPWGTGIGFRMYLMVDLFFVLSGFIILHVYGAWFSEQVSWVQFKKFFRARFARIYPLHGLMLFTFILLLFISAQLGQRKEPMLEIENDWFSVVTNLLLIHSMNVHDWFSWVHASWSISTEWWMYMVFPFLVIPVFKLNNAGRVLVMLAAFGGYWLITLILLPALTIPPQLEYMRPSDSLLTINVAFQYGFIRCAIGFIMGMMVYRWYQEGSFRKTLGSGYSLMLLTALLLVCFHFNAPDAVSVMIFPLILLSAAYGSPSVDQLFSRKPLQRLGDWSYAVYLTHQPILLVISIIIEYLAPSQPGQTFLKPSPEIGWIIAVAVLGLTLGSSALLHKYWEKPMRRWINPEYR